jgi:glycosyltransferase involved in cell wall biosynthesis
MRPRVLFLSCHLPWPALSGGRRRELELIRRLSLRFDVHLLAVSKTPEQDIANAHVLERWCRRVEVVAARSPTAPGDHDEPWLVLRHRSPAAERRVVQILAEEAPDLVHVEGFYLMQHVPGWSRVPVLLVEQYELERQRAKTVRDELARRRYRRTRVAEVAAWMRATQLAAVTAEDAAAMRRTVPRMPVRVVPDGADHVALRQPSGGDGRDREVVLVANFAYAPNVDAARYFCRDILPRIAVPDLRVWLVGNAPPGEVEALAAEQVVVTGRVPDVLPYLDAAAVVVCPLRIGGGIKVKTIEALRRGKAIVSSSIGAQGLEGSARLALSIADDPAGFAVEVRRLLHDRAHRSRLAARAHDAAVRLATWDDAAGALMQAYEDLLRADRAAQSRTVVGGLG